MWDRWGRPDTGGRPGRVLWPAADCRSRRTGDNGAHDFIDVLGDLGLLHKAQPIGRGVHAFGFLMMVAALAWGAFPVVTAYVAQTGSLDASAVIAAAACTALSAGQRALSTPVRRLRRHTASVSGTIVADDGSATPLDASALRAAPEQALRLLSVAMPLLAAALILPKLLN